MFGAEISKLRVEGVQPGHWHWPLDQVLVKIHGKPHDLWRAANYKGKVLKCFGAKRRDQKARVEILEENPEAPRPR